ncbi:TspO/MBR related protein [Halopolyspora algeriensis]|uniref:TspO/MBR related protein n=1 Tax=Halopolyspora algeriensis TaxID=1500506 RepID=A0A368VUB1_9ACTN|nr:TspO/MBR family protein [Halopolyspora algeriensis]RCW44663.1 TspO/MBR related protein [Halopolyspora algeriensis]TQM56024.1 TspO/MBR related protein [Halopolyspora algeriensis]
MSRRRSAAGAGVFAGLVIAAAAVGSVAVGSAGRTYSALQLPAWAPPAWLFGPVWSVLYTMIAVSGWLLWRNAGGIAPARLALGFYAGQLVLNAAWTPLFFGARRYGLALIEILLLVVVLIVTVVLFARRHRIAAGLLLPYLGWTIFAACLNAAIWMLNR